MAIVSVKGLIIRDGHMLQSQSGHGRSCFSYFFIYKLYLCSRQQKNKLRTLKKLSECTVKLLNTSIKTSQKHHAHYKKSVATYTYLTIGVLQVSIC